MPRIATALVFVLAVLPGCGEDDKKDVEQTVKDFAMTTHSGDSKKFCEELVTQQYLEQSTGAKGDKAEDACKSQFEGSKRLKLKLEEIRSTRIDGERATVKVVLDIQGQKQDQVFRLRKEEGDWRLAGGSGG